MKRLTFFSLICVSLAMGDEAKSTLTFADNSRITAIPLSADGDQKVMRLTSPSIEGEVDIKTDQLLEMKLGGKATPRQSDHYALATIMPRHDKVPPTDSIRGRLLHLDDDTITLDTFYAGKLTLKRSMVSALDIYSQSPSFYSGPNGPDGWVSSDGDVEDHWTFQDRSMTSKGRNGIARKVEVPERAKITFKAAWKTSPYFRILFLSNDGDSDYPGIAYTLNIQQTYLNLYRTAPGQRSDIMSESINNLRETLESDFTIYLDRSLNGTSAIYIGKDRIGTWTGVDDTKGMGDWIHFAPQQSQPMRFSNIAISQWDGVLPKAGEELKNDPSDEFGDDLEGERITLSNGDVVIGKILTIENDFVIATTTFGDVRIPVNRMSAIDLAKAALTKKKDADGKELEPESTLEEPRMWKQDIRAWFHEGGSITIRLAKIEDGKIKGSSQVFGEAEFDLSAFSRLEFNIWRRELDPARYGSDDSW